MNLNEVIANRANELAGGSRGDKQPVHPNDHVNRGQSTNDTFPTAMHVSAALRLREKLFPALDALLETLDRKAVTYREVVKVGRTHLQDATPVTLGQEIGGWAAQLRLARASVEAAQPALWELAVGGTAVGTGLNTHPQLGEEIARRLAEKTGLPLVSAPNKFAALAGHEAFAALSGALSTLAGSLFKIANDVRWLASGPRCGLGEIRIPENEPGSSIMPGKVNPTQSEALIMVCLQVLGNHTTVSFAASQGSFELNVCKPVIAYNVLQSIELLADASRSFARHCLRGIEPDEQVLADRVERSLMLVTALAPHVGYDEAARIAKKAHEEDITLREAALELGSVSAEQFDAWVQPDEMLGPEAADGEG
jgi:fumarate hydratase class II